MTRRETPLWRRYLRFVGSDPAADVDDELAFHLATRADELVRGGLPEPEARRRAAREFGDVEGVRRQLREIGRARLKRERRARGWESLAQDLRFAARALRRSPGFTVAAVATLALGIAAATAVFAVVHGVLLRPLPVRAQDEAVVLWTRAPSGAADHLPATYADLAALRARTRALRGVEGVAYQGALEQVVRDGAGPFTLRATWVTGGFFPLLGVAPLHGRTLLPADDVPGAAPVVVIGHGLWRRRFGGDPAAVGRRLEWNGKRYTIAGVLPRGFEYPAGAEAWAPALPDFPATLDAAAGPSEVLVFDLVGRLAPGATARAAGADFEALLRERDPERPAALRGLGAVVTPLAERITGDARGVVWAAAAAVGLLLLIACANVAGLLLVRGAARTRELAVRAALGAGKGRLLRQLLTESALLALLGGAAGTLLALGAVRALAALAPPELPRREMIGAGLPVFLFALGVTAAAALLAGALPALAATAGEPGAWLRGGRGASAGRGARRLRDALVVGQVALAVAVAVAAGLLLRTFVALQRVELGFDAERLLVVQTALPPELLPDRPRQVALQEAMVARAAALPGVAGAAALPRPPFSAEGGWSAMYTGEGQTPEAQAANPQVGLEVVGPGYFRTLGVPLLGGRPFGAGDREGAPPVAVVSEAVARHTWPGEDPVGKRVKLGAPGGPGAWHTVVGVVGETRYWALDAPRPALYLPARQFPGPVPMALAVRAGGDPAGIVEPLRRALREVHPELGVAGGGPVERLLDAPLARPRFGALLLGVLAAVTLALAAVGIHGVTAAAVRQRTRELGVRLALGARPAVVRRMVLGQGMRLALLGCALGTAGALLAARALRGLLFGVRPADPATFAAVVGLVLAAAALACGVPARRAARVDPAEVLRDE